jgi:hypothetical protein
VYLHYRSPAVLADLWDWQPDRIAAQTDALAAMTAERDTVFA